MSGRSGSRMESSVRSRLANVVAELGGLLRSVQALSECSRHPSLLNLIESLQGWLDELTLEYSQLESSIKHCKNQDLLDMVIANERGVTVFRREYLRLLSDWVRGVSKPVAPQWQEGQN